MRVKDRRDRKCGPGHKLTVTHCSEHGLCFTLYPLGWVPFAREPLIAEDRSAKWKGTLFRVLVVTAAARSARELDGHRRTRHRQIARAARWLGVDGEAAVGERIACRLGTGLAAHQGKRQEYAGSKLWSMRARAAVGVLRECRSRHDLLWGMLVCGCHAGMVGRPWRVCSQSGALLPVR